MNKNILTLTRTFRGFPVILLLLIGRSVSAQERPPVPAGTDGPAIPDFKVEAVAKWRHMTFRLSREAILRTPDWTPGGPAPLSPEKAIGIARKVLLQAAGEKDFAGCIPHEVHLSALYGTGYRKWYYTIEFGKLARFKDPWSGADHTTIVTGGDVDVAMDGTAGVPPE